MTTPVRGRSRHRRLVRYAILALAALSAVLYVPATAREWVHGERQAGDLVLAADGMVAPVVADPHDHAVVAIAARDLAADLATVTGGKPGGTTQVWLGTLGRSPAIDRLVKARRIDARRLTGAWESFVIAPVDRPSPGVARALVIVGSDRRGTAFGAYELSRAIGVSPWHWWADVTPLYRATLFVGKDVRRFGPPSVKYRGLYLNDEDWGLLPWAARTHEPEAGTIGPRTYARLFELALRLKANTVWPAMHKVTRAFNADPENARTADRYAIVMGSSHAEPMLRNNVGEWTAPADTFNYLTNPNGVASYWRERAQTNARFESIWTLGMRGIHDSGIVGPKTDDERRVLLERIFADQRAMLRDHVNPDVARVPQVFTPYKEVLDIYRTGLKVPDDVTLMWPDDNFGYLRHLPDATERARAGGSGVYYHLSYLGAPLSYLWLSTTPPALVREEMGRAWDAGARTMWIANVGDLKPAELDLDYFLRLAWDVPGTRARTIDAVVEDWARDTIGADVAGDVATIMAEHHRLNFVRRPEHLQWWLPGDLSRASPLPPGEIAARVTAFARLTERVAALAPRIAAERRDAFFELVDYPVTSAALANARVFAAEASDRRRDLDRAGADHAGAVARAADAAIVRLTRRFNEETAGGKWRGIMAPEPADGQWRRFRLTPPVLPAGPTPAPAAPAAILAEAAALLAAPAPATPVIEAESASAPHVRRVDGLGRNGIAVSAESPARLSYSITLPAGRWRMVAEILPTYATDDRRPLGLDVAVDGGSARSLTAARLTGDAAWSRAVLDNRIDLPLAAPLDAGTHRIAITLADRAVVLDRIRFDPVAAVATD